MINMKEGELTPLFTQNDEDGIPEIPHFGDIE
jgi:hypothetical protein